MTVLHTQRLGATESVDGAPEIVLLHGWGMSSAVWAPWLPYLRRRANLILVDLPGYGGSVNAACDNTEALIDAVLASAPERAVYLGYSLGGMLATAIAARFPQRVEALVTLASNARFVAEPGWPAGMDAATYDAFAASLEKPAVALKRFAGLQVLGCERDKALLRWFRAEQEPLSAQALATSLDWLRSFDLRAAIDELQVPARFCFAENDALVPVAAAESFPADATAIVPGAAHALFLSHPQHCADLLWQFLQQQCLLTGASDGHVLRNKRDVARSFSRAAETYDSVAELQREVGTNLLQRGLLPDDVEEGVVVDLGCGTGYFYPALRSLYPRAQLLGVDLASGMVEHAAHKHDGGNWLCGDAENLPLADDSVALFFSSLTIQWCENFGALFSEIYRVLKPGGWLVYNTLGPDTLHELRGAWERVDNCVHVNRFADWQRLSQSMQWAGFAEVPAVDEEIQVLEYDSLRELTRELKSLGAHNVNPGRPQGLTGKQRLKQFMEAYEQSRNARDKLPATYQVWYGALQKPHA